MNGQLNHSSIIGRRREMMGFGECKWVIQLFLYSWLHMSANRQPICPFGPKIMLYLGGERCYVHELLVPSLSSTFVWRICPISSTCTTVEVNKSVLWFCQQHPCQKISEVILYCVVLCSFIPRKINLWKNVQCILRWWDLFLLRCWLL